MQRLILKCLAALLCLFPMFAFAISMSGGNNLGVAASNLNEVTAFIYNILDVILYMGGAVLGMSGVMKYRLHRRNPQQVPLSTPVTELSIAAVLIGLAILAQVSEGYQTVSTPSSGTPNQYYPH